MVTATPKQEEGKQRQQHVRQELTPAGYAHERRRAPARDHEFAAESVSVVARATRMKAECRARRECR